MLTYSGCDTDLLFMKNAFIGLLIGCIIVAAGYAGYQYLNPEPEWMKEPAPHDDSHDFHVHADFAVYINGERFNFAQEKYMTSTNVCHAAFQEKHLHMHDMNGDVVHSHEAGQHWSQFFDTIGFKLTDSSLTTDTGTVFKNEGNKKWHFFVNDQEVSTIADREFADLDRVLLSYGEASPAQLQTQRDAVTHKACIYSKKCPVPEGVVLPPENCSSDL